MGELREGHRAAVAHHAERPRLGLDPGLADKAADHAARNEIEKLLEDAPLDPGWCLFVHYTLPGGRDFKSTAARFQPVLVKACGMAVEAIQIAGSGFEPSGGYHWRARGAPEQVPRSMVGTREV
jgi:hypothetical protein